MDGASKIGLSIVAAAALLLFGFIAYREYEKQQAAEAIEAAVDQFQREMKQLTPARSTPSFDPRAAHEAAERWRQVLQLQPDEQCIGGTVVRVSGSSYTQVSGGSGRPVACAGRQRLDFQR